MKRYIPLRMAATAVLLAVMWLMLSSASLAHYCDDHYYYNQQARENCWWRYWNGLPLEQPGTTYQVQVVHYKTIHVTQYTTKPHRLHPNDPRIAPWDRVRR